METKLNLDLIAIELDAVHAAARRVFRARNLSAYGDFFTHDLQYIQPDGIAIGRDQLMRDVAEQFAQFRSVDSEITRESIVANDDGTVTQTLRQTGSYSVTVFFIFTKTWMIQRQGKYTYRNTEDGWRICDVGIQSENVK